MRVTRFFLSITVLSMVCGYLFAPFAFAATKTEEILLGPETQGAYTKLPQPSATYSPAETISKVINLLFGFIAILAVSLIMYGGFLWVTSGGEQDKAKKAQELLTDAAVGIVVLAAVWSLAWLILKALTERVIAK